MLTIGALKRLSLYLAGQLKSAVDITGGTITGVSLTGSSVSVTGGLTSSGVGGSRIGYTTGAGSTVTQATNRTTGVTINTVCGQITTSTASLAAETAAEFTVTTSTVTASADQVIVSIASGSNGGNTAVAVTGVAAGSFKIKVSNNNAAAGTAETGAIIINFTVIKSVNG